MLTIKHTLVTYTKQLIISPIILTLAFSATAAHNETNPSLLKEPIVPIPLIIPVEPAKAQLGKILFFDTRLSKKNNIACSTCHQLKAGGDDNIAKGLSMTSDVHVINTPTVFNAVFNFRQNWDGSAKSLEDQIDMVLINHHEFNNQWSKVLTTLSQDEKLNNSFKAVYKTGLTRKNILNALVAFEKTLITPNSRFDDYLRNKADSLSEEEIQGYTLFKTYGCISCHQGVNIGGNLFQKFGIFQDYIAYRGNVNKQDYGKFNYTNRQMDKFVFKVPSLRNVDVTAPYLHDGSAETLERVIEIMGKTQLGRALSDKDISLIKSFLKTLTGKYKNKFLGEIQ